MNLKDMSKAAGLGEPFTQEQNEEYYQRMIAGDEKARNEIIEGNLALVVYRVDLFISTSPQMAYYRDDLISAGLIGLCKVVDYMGRNRAIRKPTGRITKEIDRYIQHLADESNTIRVPSRTQILARKNGILIRPPRIVSDKVLVNEIDTKYQEEVAAKELSEELYACCKNDFEKKILSMRFDNLTDKEIAKELNCCASTISRCRKKIEKRFNQRCPEYRQTERAKVKND